MVFHGVHVNLAICCGFLALLQPCGAQIMSVDIGHEFFKVALMRQGVPLEIVLNSHSKRKTPTAVSFFEQSRAFGDDALAHTGKAPSKVPLFFHWMMGKNLTAPEDVSAGGEWWKSFGLSDKFYTYSLRYDEERGVAAFEFSSENSTSMEEALANIFYFAKTMAEESADGKAVKDLVVTIPSNANLRQRQAIVAAGEIAGCRVLTLVHEGSAFAVQRAVDFQPEKGTSDIVLFYNLGSRKAEVSIVKFDSKQAGMVAGKTAPVVTVLGSAIDYGVGGHLMDLKIAEMMLKQFQGKNPKLADGIVKNPRAMRKLLSQAQKTKAILSANKNAPFIVESLFQDVDFQSSLRRDDFEEMCKDLFAQLTAPIDKAIEAANITGEDVTQVELVGGAWRVPKVQQLLSEHIEAKKAKKLQLGQHLNGEEASALGAALVGANSSSSFRVKKIFFTDITLHEYAVQVASLTGEWEKNLTILYPVGAAFGGKKKLAFSLDEDFEVRLFEDGVLIALYQVTGLVDVIAEKWGAYNTTGQPKISVSVPLDMSGIIEVKSPTATVEELYWVNVTKEKPKANASSSNATGSNDTVDNETSSSSAEDGKGEEAVENASVNASAANDTEVEVIQKQKKKKHEKKLNITRVDFRPMPLSEDGIAASRKKLEALAKREMEVAKVTALKNELEASIYGSRDKMERDDIVKVSTEEQREEVSKLCMEYEEWMYEGSVEKQEYESRLSKLQDLLGPMEERALELESRADLSENVQEIVDDVKAMRDHIAKNMSWVAANKTADAEKKLVEFEEWWAKKQTSQKSLPLHEAPAFTRAEVIEKINKVHKEFDRLKKIKKPKEAKKPKKNATTAAGDDQKKADAGAESSPEDADAALPADVEGTEKEIAKLRDQKASAVEAEDYDRAHSLKAQEKKLVEHLAKLKAAKSEL